MSQVIKVKVMPGTGKNNLIEIQPGIFEARIKAKPEQGKANAALIHVLAKHFGIPVSSIKIFTGKTSRSKLVKIS